MGVSEVISPVTYAPEMGDVGMDSVAEHEFPQGVDRAPKHIPMTFLSIG